MSSGAYAVAISMNDLREAKAMRQLKFEGARESLLQYRGDNSAQDSIKQEVVDTMEVPVSRSMMSVCVLL